MMPPRFVTAEPAREDTVTSTWIRESGDYIDLSSLPAASFDSMTVGVRHRAAAVGDEVEYGDRIFPIRQR